MPTQSLKQAARQRFFKKSKFRCQRSLYYKLPGNNSSKIASSDASAASITSFRASIFQNQQIPMPRRLIYKPPGIEFSKYANSDARAVSKTSFPATILQK
ncbi:MAG: hypothetical protein K6E49_08565 [Lachnospiraceae bacterium]|nr:hypothetical protein [Lachnospiraceae bacterium]